MKSIVNLMGAAALAVMTSTAFAAEQPAVVYDLGGKYDKSFNESAYTGAEKYKTDTGIAYRDFEIQNDSQREQGLRNFARRGHNPIVAIGFSQARRVEKVAKEFPDTKFAIVDMVVDLPNVRSSSSRSMRAPIWSACWRRWPRRPARSASSAAWTFR